MYLPAKQLHSYVAVPE